MEKVYVENNISIMFPDASLNVYRVLGLALQRILKTNHIENVDFILLANDYISPPFGTEQLIINAPIFLMSKDLSFQLKKDHLLLPDAYILDDKAWPKLVNKIILGWKTFPWKKTYSSKIFWWGTTIGGIHNFENYDKLPRLTVVMIACNFPKLIDARFMHYDQFNYSYNESSLELFKFLNTLFDSSGSLVEGEHLAYKFATLVLGVACLGLLAIVI